ncbi:DUF1236 domain-containing protein [Micromonospora sp. STR1s_5]|nr:DUF1236 domain-containing protein [Micromonospora sp. STR1s_5]
MANLPLWLFGITSVIAMLTTGSVAPAGLARRAVRHGRAPDRVTYYDVPSDYKVTKYKYTIVNDRPVLVDPGSHTIVQIIE